MPGKEELNKETSTKAKGSCGLCRSLGSPPPCKGHGKAGGGGDDKETTKKTDGAGDRAAASIDKTPINLEKINNMISIGDIELGKQKNSSGAICFVFQISNMLDASSNVESQLLANKINNFVGQYNSSHETELIVDIEFAGDSKIKKISIPFESDEQANEFMSKLASADLDAISSEPKKTMPKERDYERYKKPLDETLNVVLLLGASSSGKSTLGNELKDKYDYHFSCTDDLFEPKFVPMYRREIRDELESHDLISPLAKYMTADQVAEYCRSGNLMIKDIHGKEISLRVKPPEFRDLESKLIETGYKDKEFTDVLHALQKVGKYSRPMPAPFYQQATFDDALNIEEHKKRNVIIDIVPDLDDENGLNDLISRFDQSISNFRKEHPDVKVTSNVTLAYYPPDKLAERISDRNAKAETSGDHANKRVGLFPLEQLSVLVDTRAVDTKAKISDFESKGKLSSLKVDDLLEGSLRMQGVDKVTAKTITDLPISSRQEAVENKNLAMQYKKSQALLAEKYRLSENDGDINVYPKSGAKFTSVIDMSRHDALSMKESASHLADDLVKTTNTRPSVSPRLTRK